MKTVKSIKLLGADYVPVQIECNVTAGIGIHLVGLADVAVKETLLRTVTAMQAVGFRIPGKKIVINIAPADLLKSGCAYDLPVALAMVAASGQDEGRLNDLDEFLVIGEMGLDASVRDVPGALQAIRAAGELDFKGCIIPEGCMPAVAELIDDSVPVYPVTSLMEAIEVIAHPQEALTAKKWLEKRYTTHPELLADHRREEAARRWSQLSGNMSAKRALEIAAAGGHPLLLMGAPGSGKDSIARCLADLLPPMSPEQVRTTNEIYSAARNGCGRHFRDALSRPFRSPHISASMAAMLGGGSGDGIHPGEVSLAHNGVLFIDEAAEAPKALIEGLRGPLEDHKVVISRLRSKVEYPAHFHLVAATNPCPCGYYGEGERCSCTPTQRNAYLARLSGPVFDHLTIQLWCRQSVPGTTESVTGRFADVAERVLTARRIQQERYKEESYSTNDELSSKDVDKYIRLDEDCRLLVEKLLTTLGLSARSYSRILRIARTIADLDGSEEVRTQHLAEAASYRFLDRTKIE